MSGRQVTTRVLEPPSDSHAAIRTAAFRLLLQRSSPIGAADLEAATGVRRERIVGLLDALEGAGRIRRDDAGNVVGSAGLSITVDRHEIELDGQRFWTWCAYDILGIFGALGASGRAQSPSPDGTVIEVHFERGRPVKNPAVLFRPDDKLMTECDNVYEQWCPNSNLFASRELAERWALQHAVDGRVLDLTEAGDIATHEWSDVV